MLLIRCQSADVSLGATIARQAGLDVETTYARLAGQGNDLVNADAMEAEDAHFPVEQGKALGRDLAGRHLICLGEVGVGNTTVAAALSCRLLGLPAG